MGIEKCEYAKLQLYKNKFDDLYKFKCYVYSSQKWLEGGKQNSAFFRSKNANASKMPQLTSL